jgi:hypothetical protein
MTLVHEFVALEVGTLSHCWRVGVAGQEDLPVGRGREPRRARGGGKRSTAFTPWRICAMWDIVSLFVMHLLENRNGL